jgi:hypothetical protein
VESRQELAKVVGEVALVMTGTSYSMRRHVELVLHHIEAVGIAQGFVEALALA